MAGCILEYPLWIGWREPASTTRTGGEGEMGGTGEATKASRAGSWGYAPTLETFFADLIIHSALVLVTEYLERFGDLGMGEQTGISKDEVSHLFELFRSLL